jgi:hypothetical protein
MVGAWLPSAAANVPAVQYRHRVRICTRNIDRSDSIGLNTASVWVNPPPPPGRKHALPPHPPCSNVMHHICVKDVAAFSAVFCVQSARQPLQTQPRGTSHVRRRWPLSLSAHFAAAIATPVHSRSQLSAMQQATGRCRAPVNQQVGLSSNLRFKFCRGPSRCRVVSEQAGQGSKYTLCLTLLSNCTWAAGEAGVVALQLPPKQHARVAAMG